MIKFEVGKRYYFKADDTETLYCTKKDKSYTSNARWVAK